jgi:hypothetical protein
MGKDAFGLQGSAHILRVTHTLRTYVTIGLFDRDEAC